MARIHRMIDRAVADSLVVHHFHDFGDGAYIFLCFAVQFYIRDMPTACDGVERSFALDFLYNANLLFYIHVERVDIIIPIRHSGNLPVLPSVHFGETSGESFGGSSQNRVIQVVFRFVFVYYLIHFHHRFVQRVPCLPAVSVPLSVECHHRVVSADESDSQRSAAQYVAHLLVRVQVRTAFPYIIPHHERELACKSCTLVLITFVKLVCHQSSHRVHGFNENLLSLLFYGSRVAFVLYQILRLDAGFDGESRHIERGERQIASSQ